MSDGLNARGNRSRQQQQRSNSEGAALEAISSTPDKQRKKSQAQGEEESNVSTHSRDAACRAESKTKKVALPPSPPRRLSLVRHTNKKKKGKIPSVSRSLPLHSSIVPTVLCDCSHASCSLPSLLRDGTSLVGRRSNVSCALCSVTRLDCRSSIIALTNVQSTSDQ